MITFGPTMCHNALKLQVIVEEVSRHDGRFFVGEDPQTRREMRTSLEALNTFITQAQAGGKAKLYLTPRPVNDRRTRQDKWNEACNQAREGLERMARLRTDIHEWSKKLTRRGSQNTTDAILSIVNLDVDAAQEMVDNASTMLIPKGFGRD